MGNPELGRNDHQLSDEEWASLETVSRADLPKPEEILDPHRLPSEEEMREHETNLNSRTGKERTTSTFDLNPIKKGETAQEYGERLRRQSDMTVWAELVSYDEYREKYSQNKTNEEANLEYNNLIKDMVAKYPREEGEQLASYRERVKNIVNSISEANTEPLDKQAKFDRIKERLTTAAAEGRMTEDHVKRLIENQLARYVDKKVSEGGAQSDRKALLDELLHPEGFEAEEPLFKPEVKTEAKTATESEEKLDSEVQEWLDEEMKNVKEYESYGKYTPEQITRFKEELQAKAREKQTALDRERTKSTEGEAEKAKEAEAEKAKERAEEAEKEKQLEEIRILEDEFLEKARIYHEKVKEFAGQEIERMNKAEEQMKKHPGFGVWLLSFFAGKRRKKANAAEKPEEIEKIEEPISSKPEIDFGDEFKTAADFDIREHHFWSSIGEDGIEYMKDKEPLNNEKTAAIEKWWESLDDQTKNGFSDMRYRIGLTLRTFLINKGVIPPDTGDYLSYDLSKKPENASRIQENIDRLDRDYHFWNSIGEDGIKYITSKEEPNEENTERIMNWWTNLEPDTQAGIVNKTSCKRFVNWMLEKRFLNAVGEGAEKFLVGGGEEMPEGEAANRVMNWWDFLDSRIQNKLIKTPPRSLERIVDWVRLNSDLRVGE
ncbi:hypothetical protein IJI29_02120 [Candidatus Saccharibacteria bacterium]|nr:hypothetical protein [Candidatus Saccharibacteria bacterium]